MATQPKNFVPVEEYLKQVETAVNRLEYFNGEIFAMSGGTPNLAFIATNIIAALVALLRGTGCRVGSADLGIKAPSGLYTYPDVVVCCKPEHFDGNYLLNPVVIVEVLSENTEAYDRGKKFEKYRQIASLRAYLLVAQDRTHVERYVRGEGTWTLREFNGMDDVIALNVVNATLPLSLIYADIDFDVLPATS